VSMFILLLLGFFPFCENLSADNIETCSVIASKNWFVVIHALYVLPS